PARPFPRPALSDAARCAREMTPAIAIRCRASCGASSRYDVLKAAIHGVKSLSTIVRRIPDMAVRIEKDGPAWTVIHSRPEARNAMDPESADALTAAFLEFDADKDACVAVFYGAGGAFCAGWDLKYVSTLDADYPLGELDISTARPRGNGGEIPRGPLG